MSQYHPLSVQRQTSAKHSLVEMEAPAGTCPWLSSASAWKVSLESTVKQVGFFWVGPTEPGLLGGQRGSQEASWTSHPERETPKSVVTWREEGTGWGSLRAPPTHRCTIPLSWPLLLPPPIPSSRCPLLPPPESLPAARANPLGVLQRWTPVPPAPASTEAGVRTVVGPTCACVQRASLATTVRPVRSQARCSLRASTPLTSLALLFVAFTFLHFHLQ